MSFQPNSKIPVAVLGATGTVGQRMISLLAEHPWFSLVELAASDRRAGQRFGDAVDWKLPGDPPRAAAGLTMKPCDAAAVQAPLVFSALDAQVAGEIEEQFAQSGRLVVSNARNHRMDPDVPLLVPEVNADHLALLERQRTRRGHGGSIVTNPNCSTIALTLALAPLHKTAQIEKAVVTTLQAISGAGFPGVPSLEILDNVVPFIRGEEAKIITEPRKIFGELIDGEVREAPIAISAQVHRVPVIDGHLVSVSLSTKKPLDPDQARAVLAAYRAEPQRLGLPSAPEIPIVVRNEEDRPQPRLDRDAGRGMAAVVGQIRVCPVLGLRLEILGHNTVRGAAGGTVLIGELLVARGLLS